MAEENDTPNVDERFAGRSIKELSNEIMNGAGEQGISEWALAGMTFANELSEKQELAAGFSNLSAEKKNEWDGKLTRRFNEHGFDGASPYEIILTLERFKAGALGIEPTPENLNIIASMVAKLPKENDQAFVHNGKVREAVAANIWFRRQGMGWAAKRIENQEQKKAKELNKIEEKYIKSTSKKNYETTQEEWHAKRDNAKWFGSRWYYKARNGLNTAFGLTRELKEKKIGHLSQASENRRWYNPMKYWAKVRLGMVRRGYEKSEKNWMQSASLTQLQMRQAEITQSIQSLQNQRANMSKRDQKIVDYQLQQQNRLLAVSGKAQADIGTKVKKASQNVNKKYDDKIQKLQSKVSHRFDVFSNRLEHQEYSTTAGQYMESVMSHASAEQRKQFDSMFLERKNEAFEDEADYKKFLEDQLISGGYKGKHQDTIIEALVTERPDLQKEQQTLDDYRQDNGQVNDGDSNTPPADNNLWHEQSQTALDKAYEKYEKVDSSHQSANQNILVSTYQKDDREVTVEKPDANTYNVSAKDKEGKDTVPSVDDMVAAIQALKIDGHTSMELGSIKSKEFLDNAVKAAESCGMSITNLEEKRKELDERLKSQEKQTENTSPDSVKEPQLKPEIKREQEKRQEKRVQDTFKGVDIDISTAKGKKSVRNRMDALVEIQNKTPEEYAKYKESGEYKKLSAKEKKLFDSVNNLKNNKQFKNIDEKKQAIILGRMLEGYKKAYDGKGAKGGARTKAKDKFIENNAVKFNLGKQSGR